MIARLIYHKYGDAHDNIQELASGNMPLGEWLELMHQYATEMIVGGSNTYHIRSTIRLELLDGTYIAVISMKSYPDMDGGDELDINNYELLISTDYIHKLSEKQEINAQEIVKLMTKIK